MESHLRNAGAMKRGIQERIATNKQQQQQYNTGIINGPW
jgi:hypothetical protein